MILMASLVLADINNAALYESAYSAYEKNNCGKAIELFEKLSKKEVSNASNHLGLMYRSGKCRKQNYSLAMNYFLLASSQGSGVAAYNIAGMYMKGEGVAIDNGKAFPYLKRAASVNYPQAAYDMGIFYNDGLAVEKDTEIANSWFRKASSLGIGEASFRLGQQLYFDDNKNPVTDLKRLEEAKKYLLLGIEQNNSKSAYLLAWGYLVGIYTDKQPIYGVDLLKLSVKLGHSKAAGVLADFYRGGLYVNINKKESEKFKILSEKLSEQ